GERRGPSIMARTAAGSERSAHECGREPLAYRDNGCERTLHAVLAADGQRSAGARRQPRCAAARCARGDRGGVRSAAGFLETGRLREFRRLVWLCVLAGLLGIL